MSWKRLLLNLVGILAIVTAIWVFGPMFSGYIDKNYRKKIDKNGKAVMAVISGKNSHKVKSVYFFYIYNGKIFTNHEANDNCYFKSAINDSIEIFLDSVNPGNSYILSPSKYK